MSPVGVANTTILTDYAQKSPGSLLKSDVTFNVWEFGNPLLSVRNEWGTCCHLHHIPLLERVLSMSPLEEASILHPHEYARGGNPCSPRLPAPVLSSEADWWEGSEKQETCASSRNQLGCRRTRTSTHIPGAVLGHYWADFSGRCSSEEEACRALADSPTRVFDWIDLDECGDRQSSTVVV